MGNSVTSTIENGVCILRIENPPVNVLTHAVREDLAAAVRASTQDPTIRAVVLMGNTRFFLSGADIREFATGLADPTPVALTELAELSDKPIIAALTGPVLGIGLELAMACHYRISDLAAQLGMPEITLGVVPGAGGTQRLPRLVGTKAALDMLLSGKPLSAPQALSLRLIDEVASGDLLTAALAAADRLATLPFRRTRDLTVPESTSEVLDAAIESARTRMPGRTTPQLIIEAVRASALPFSAGLRREAELVQQSLAQLESRALRHLFFAEREAQHVQGLPPQARSRQVASVAVIGSGTMGGGIAMCFADAGLPVRILDTDSTALEKGLSRIRSNYDVSVKKGTLAPEEAAHRCSLIQGTTSYQDLSAAELFIEAVPENIGLKQDIFKQLDAVAKPGAILATNTSTLDIDRIAAVTARPGDVIGLHFFSPANVMRLLEIVRTDSTADDALTTALALARRIRKIAVVSRVCYGFIGNRMMDPYAREAERALLEGATPAQVDGALEQFGMAMGILAVFDMAGVDVAALTRRESADPTYFRCSSILHQQGWLGQKTGRGFYRYEGRQRLPHPQAEELFRQEAHRLGIEQRVPEAQEIQQRCLFGMVNEAALILQEGIAQRPSDIDVVYTAGYGFPRHRGGPLFCADSLGLPQVLQGIESFAQRFGRQNWTPAPLLCELARAGRTFAGWSRES
ncbi:MAG TPA: 3-hydroxyacyl-CoA dehydrogenase NAD-binding domain-containing protein [Steroidobacteraceae bacterium]|nr:3-hydroxyacyl-CoA dehydrogenase NAD-binding domain-containing protein [Steroidobacteraceae bacterium]